MGSRKQVSMRQQPQTDQTPLIPPTAGPSTLRPTADEWFHVVSDEPLVSEPPTSEPPASEPQDHQAGSRKTPALAVVGALTIQIIAAIGITWILTTNGGTSDLAKCDTWLRAQLVNSPGIAASARNANAAIAAIQGTARRGLSPQRLEPARIERHANSRWQHRSQVRVHGQDLERPSGDHARRRHATLVIHSCRSPVVLSTRRRSTDLGRETHQYFTYPTADYAAHRES